MKPLSYSPHTTTRDENHTAHRVSAAGNTAAGEFREAVGFFPDMESLQNAVRELEGSAFPRDAISVLGARDEIEKHFGSRTVNPDIAENDPDAPRQAPVRPEEKNIGAGALVGGVAYLGAVSAALMTMPASLPVSLAAVALGGGGGAAIGAALVSLLGHRLDLHTAEQMDKGGLLLWVRTPDVEREDMAYEIMKHHGAKDIRIHDMAH